MWRKEQGLWGQNSWAFPGAGILPDSNRKCVNKTGLIIGISFLSHSTPREGEKRKTFVLQDQPVLTSLQSIHHLFHKTLIKFRQSTQLNSHDGYYLVIFIDVSNIFCPFLFL
jgi:hypothetical protein